VIENAKHLITKEKTGKFKPQRQKDQLNTALETEEHGRKGSWRTFIYTRSMEDMI
jgi:hypothetical protein